MDGLLETKSSIGGRIIEVKQEDRNGVPVGIVSGHIATWELDVMAGRFGKPDKFHPGAFLNSIADHKRRANGMNPDGRQVRLKDMHGRAIGGFPIIGVREDSVGLAATGEINLQTQLGMEAHSLARQGVLTDFSIGFIAIDDKLGDFQRDIFEAIIMEGSIVDEPLNQGSEIAEVKSARTFRDLPLADRDTEIPEPNPSNCLLAGRFPIIAVVEGKSFAVPAATLAAAEELADDTDIPDEVKAPAILHLERYLAKMDAQSPFTGEQKQFFGVNDVKVFTRKDFEQALISTGRYSQKAARVLASRMELPEPVSGFTDLLADLKSITV